jgi:hypothetical protein
MIQSVIIRPNPFIHALLKIKNPESQDPGLQIEQSYCRNLSKKCSQGATAGSMS